MVLLATKDCHFCPSSWTSVWTWSTFPMVISTAWKDLMHDAVSLMLDIIHNVLKRYFYSEIPESFRRMAMGVIHRIHMCNSITHHRAWYICGKLVKWELPLQSAYTLASHSSVFLERINFFLNIQQLLYIHSEEQLKIFKFKGCTCWYTNLYGHSSPLLHSPFTQKEQMWGLFRL